MTRNFLEGARRKRISYTPRGLIEAWFDLDAAKKVYIGTLVGLTISVCILCDKPKHYTNNDSSFLPFCCSSVRAASMPAMASLESPPTTTSAEEDLSGSLQSLCSCSGPCSLAHGFCGRSVISRMFIHGPGKRDSPSLLGKKTCHTIPYTLLTFYIAFREPHFGSPLPTRIGEKSQELTIFLRQLGGEYTHKVAIHFIC